jgi:hypothetical protein
VWSPECELWSEAGISKIFFDGIPTLVCSNKIKMGEWRSVHTKVKACLHRRLMSGKGQQKWKKYLRIGIDSSLMKSKLQ